MNSESAYYSTREGANHMAEDDVESVALAEHMSEEKSLPPRNTDGVASSPPLIGILAKKQDESGRGAVDNNEEEGEEEGEGDATAAIATSLSMTAKSVCFREDVVGGLDDEDGQARDGERKRSDTDDSQTPPPPTANNKRNIMGVEEEAPAVAPTPCTSSPPREGRRKGDEGSEGISANERAKDVSKKKSSRKASPNSSRAQNRNKHNYGGTATTADGGSDEDETLRMDGADDDDSVGVDDDAAHHHRCIDYAHTVDPYVPNGHKYRVHDGCGVMLHKPALPLRSSNGNGKKKNGEDNTCTDKGNTSTAAATKFLVLQLLVKVFGAPQPTTTADTIMNNTTTFCGVVSPKKRKQKEAISAAAAASPRSPLSKKKGENADPSSATTTALSSSCANTVMMIPSPPTSPSRAAAGGGNSSGAHTKKAEEEVPLTLPPIRSPRSPQRGDHNHQHVLDNHAPLSHHTTAPSSSPRHPPRAEASGGEKSAAAKSLSLTSFLQQQQQQQPHVPAFMNVPKKEFFIWARWGRLADDRPPLRTRVVRVSPSSSALMPPQGEDKKDEKDDEHLLKNSGTMGEGTLLNTKSNNNSTMRRNKATTSSPTKSAAPPPLNPNGIVFEGLNCKLTGGEHRFSYVESLKEFVAIFKNKTLCEWEGSGNNKNKKRLVAAGGTGGNRPRQGKSSSNNNCYFIASPQNDSKKNAGSIAAEEAALAEAKRETLRKPKPQGKDEAVLRASMDSKDKKKRAVNRRGDGGGKANPQSTAFRDDNNGIDDGITSDDADGGSTNAGKEDIGGSAEKEARVDADEKSVLGAEGAAHLHGGEGGKVRGPGDADDDDAFRSANGQANNPSEEGRQRQAHSPPRVPKPPAASPNQRKPKKQQQSPPPPPPIPASIIAPPPPPSLPLPRPPWHGVDQLVPNREQYRVYRKHSVALILYSWVGNGHDTTKFCILQLLERKGEVRAEEVLPTAGGTKAGANGADADKLALMDPATEEQDKASSSSAQQQQQHQRPRRRRSSHANATVTSSPSTFHCWMRWGLLAGEGAASAVLAIATNDDEVTASATAAAAGSGNGGNSHCHNNNSSNNKKMVDCSSANVALTTFGALFRDKTGNEWRRRMSLMSINNTAPTTASGGGGIVSNTDPSTTATMVATTAATDGSAPRGAAAPPSVASSSSASASTTASTSSSPSVGFVRHSGKYVLATGPSLLAALGM